MGGRDAFPILAILVLVFCVNINAEICNQAVCEYSWVIRRFSTMTYYDGGEITYSVVLNGSQLVAAENSWRRKEDYPFIGTVLHPRDVITGDGYKRDVITINDKFPGPDIHVISGAQVVIHVWNRLVQETTTIHWHGVHQQDTPWMDGVPYITQCPILPRQKFTYRFMATPHGTHWYHAHMGSQRLDGLYGMLIIYPEIPTTPEFVFTINDWFHVHGVSYELQNPVGVEKPGTGEMIVDIRKRDFILDNNHVTIIQFDGALINGRGRWNDEKFPLEEFNVTQGQKYRFRLAATGVEYSFHISIDNHVIDIVALDGVDIQPIRVDSFMIHSGEALDFELVTDQVPERYWLRAVTLRAGIGPDPQPDGTVKGVNAIINYEGSSSIGDPTSSDRECSAANPCKVFNCPYGKRPARHHKTCIGVEDAISTTSALELDRDFGLNDPDSEVVEYFFNFAFSIGSAVDARKYIPSRAPLYRPDIDQYTTACDDSECVASGCRCTNIGEIPFNKTIQMVLINLTPTAKFMGHHAVHLHGHSFAVLKIGYATNDPITGRWADPNRDVECHSDNLKICTKARWTNGRPELNKVNPPVKNTVIVPSRGYAVIRFRSNNPGFWFFHCHMEQHFIDGMAMVINEAPGRHPPLPKNFPDCHDFSWSHDEFSEYTSMAYNKRMGVKVGQPKSTPAPEPGPEHGTTSKPKPEPEPETMVLTVPMAIGVSFAFIFIGAFLPLIAVALYVCCAARSSDKKILE